MAVLLTKRAAAKRVYATVVNAGNNTDGYKEQGEDASPASLLPVGTRCAALMASHASRAAAPS